jgi:hypothetical protein
LAITLGPRDQPHPVTFDVAYPERLSRVLIFFKLFLIIPHLIAISLLYVALYMLTILAWFGVLFTGRYPKAFFEFTSGVLRWQANAVAYAALLRDEYPPFSWEPGEYPLALDIPRPERQSRFRLFVRLFTVIPNQFVLQFVSIGWAFTTFLAWFAILITGRYPRGLFKFSVGVGRWYQRQIAYYLLLRDEYPPYSINANARPGNEWVSGIIGLPFFGLYMALNFLPLFGVLGGGGAVHASLTPPERIASEHPSGRAGSLRVTLLEYHHDVRPPAGSGISVSPSLMLESFLIDAEKDGLLPTFFTPYFLSVKTCAGFVHGVETTADADWDTHFRVYWRSRSDFGTVYFRIPRGTSICELDYFTLRGQLRFEFDGLGTKSAVASRSPRASAATPTPTALRRIRTGFTPSTDGLVVHVPEAVLDSASLMQTLEPNAKLNRLIMVLNAYDSSPPPGVAGITPGAAEHVVGFRVFVQGLRPVTRNFSPSSFVITDCGGNRHRSIKNTFDMDEFKRGNVPVLNVYFLLPTSADACELTYDVPSDLVHFVFE